MAYYKIWIMSITMKPNVQTTKDSNYSPSAHFLYYHLFHKITVIKTSGQATTLSMKSVCHLRSFLFSVESFSAADCSLAM